MLDPSYGILTVVFPLVGATFALAAKAFGAEKPRARLGPPLEALGAVIALALPLGVLILTFPAIYAQRFSSAALGGWNFGVGIVFSFDGLTWLLDLLAFSIAACAYVYSRGAGPRSPAFSLVFFVLLASLAATAGTEDLFNLFVCLELSGLASYILVASSAKGGAYLASFRYLSLSSAAMGLFLIGLYGLYRLTGSLSYQGIGECLSRLMVGAGGGLLGGPKVVASLSIACVVVAVALRFAVFPVHSWLPDAHAQAPHAVSAMLSGVLLKTPLFALGRFIAIIPGGEALRTFFCVAGALTALVAVLAALSQKDAKRLLAYHSVSQIGYVLVAWGALQGGSPSGGAITAAYLHALFHGLFKACLFLTVGTACDVCGSRDVYALRGAARGLGRAGDRFPVVSLSFLIAALSIVALPPLNGYVSKTAIATVLHGMHDAPWASFSYTLLLITGVGTVASFIKLSRIFFPAMRRPPGEVAAEGAVASVDTGPESAPASIHPATRLGIAILACACIATAVFSPRLAALVARLLGETSPLNQDYLSVKELGKSALVLALGVGLFFLAISGPGKRLAAALRRLQSGPGRFTRMVFSMVLALCFLSLYLITQNWA